AIPLTRKIGRHYSFGTKITEGELVGTGRFELPTPRTPSECSTRLSHVPTRLETLTPLGSGVGVRSILAGAAAGSKQVHRGSNCGIAKRILAGLRRGMPRLYVRDSRVSGC